MTEHSETLLPEAWSATSKAAPRTGCIYVAQVIQAGGRSRNQARYYIALTWQITR
jgi:hypothetical protein